MGSYYTYGAIPDPVRTVRGFDDGGLAAAPEVGLAGAGGEDKPLMQQLYERGEISDAEYRAWLEGQAAEQQYQGGLEASPYTPPIETAGPSQEYNPVTRLPTTQGGLEASPYTPPVETSGPSQEYNPVTPLPTTQPEAAPDYSTWKGDVETGKNIMDLFKLGQERQFGPGALSSFVGPTGATPVLPGNFSQYNPNERSAAEIAADYAKLTGLDLAGLAASQGKTEAELFSDINKAEVDPNTERGALNQIKDLAGKGDFQGAFEAAKAAEARMPGKDFVGSLVSTANLRYLTPEMDKQDVNNYYDALKNVVGEREFEKRYVPTGSEFNIEDARAKNLSALEQGTNFVNPNVGIKAKEDIIGKIGGVVEPLTKAALIAAALYGGAQFLGGLGGAGGTAAGTAGTAGATGTAAGTLGGATAGGALAGVGAGTEALTEVIVAASKVGKLGQVLGALTATAGGTAALNSALNQLASSPVTPSGQTVPSDLQEVVSQASRLPPSTINPYLYPLLASTGVGLPQTGLSDIVPEPSGTTPSDLEEVTVKAQRPMDWSWLSGALAAGPTLSQIISQMGLPSVPQIYPDDVIPDQLDEVEVKAPKYQPPVIPPLPGFPEPTLQPPPDLKDILKDYTPTKITEPSTLDDLIKKYGTLENVLKVLGLLGGASTVKGGMGTGLGGKFDTSGGAGFSSGLTPFDYGRKQLSPDIDYYTYATRPEAQFFEYGQQLEQPTQPTMPPPRQPSGVITEAAGGYIDDNMTGGLIGYAKGGDTKPERYVDGPGSGREDLIPAMLSDGEYVIDAETLALLGDGSTKEGARRMDQFRANIRKHKGRALSRGRISPNAKSPDKYMGGGLT